MSSMEEVGRLFEQDDVIQLPCEFGENAHQVLYSNLENIIREVSGNPNIKIIPTLSEKQKVDLITLGKNPDDIRLVIRKDVGEVFYLPLALLKKPEDEVKGSVAQKAGHFAIASLASTCDEISDRFSEVLASLEEDTASAFVSTRHPQFESQIAANKLSEANNIGWYFMSEKKQGREISKLDQFKMLLLYGAFLDGFPYIDPDISECFFSVRSRLVDISGTIPDIHSSEVERYQIAEERYEKEARLWKRIRTVIPQ